jgi:hypothetical protein
MVYVLVHQYIKGWKNDDDEDLFDELNKYPVMGIYLDRTKALIDCININLKYHSLTIDEKFISKSGILHDEKNPIKYDDFDLDNLELIYNEIIDLFNVTDKYCCKYTEQFYCIREYELDKLIENEKNEEDEYDDEELDEKEVATEEEEDEEAIAE